MTRRSAREWGTVSDAEGRVHEVLSVPAFMYGTPILKCLTCGAEYQGNAKEITEATRRRWFERHVVKILAGGAS